MGDFIELRGNALDFITGERVFPGGIMFDTGIIRRRRTVPSKTILLKEETIVWLAEQAGYDVVKRNAGDSGDAAGVDGEDASVGGGEVKAGKAKAGGKQPAKRRASGTTKSK